jgi:hypothetical protein
MIIPQNEQEWSGVAPLKKKEELGHGFPALRINI